MTKTVFEKLASKLEAFSYGGSKNSVKTTIKEVEGNETCFIEGQADSRSKGMAIARLSQIILAVANEGIAISFRRIPIEVQTF